MLLELRLDQAVDRGDSARILVSQHGVERSGTVGGDGADVGLDLRKFLTNQRIIRVTLLRGKREDLVDRSAVTKFVGEERGGALVTERGPHDRPAAAFFAEPVGDGHLDIVEENLREVVTACGVAQRTYFDAG